MKQRRFSFAARCWAVVLTLTMLFGMLPMMALAAEESSGATAVVHKVSDPGTVNTYQDLLGDFADGNRYAGRIWTDKSVFSQETALAEALGQELTQSQLEQLGISLEEFLVVYSALGSTTSVATETVVSSNLDVVIVLDNSRSMNSAVKLGNNRRATRLEAVVEAANTLIQAILKNSSNRLSLVSYSDDVQMLLDLDHYAQTAACLQITNGNLIAAADSLSDQSSTMQGYTISAYQSGTNVQSGINEAMQILYNAETTDDRTPVVIVMSDGEANYAAYQNMLGDTSVGNLYKQPNSSYTTADVALSTLLNAAYWKYMVGQKYGNDTLIYTVGVDVEELDDASLVLNPGDFFYAESTKGFTDVALDTLELYARWTESSATVYGTAYGSTGRPNTGSSTYTFTYAQPATQAIKDGIENNIAYADQYYEVTSAELKTVFDDILIHISSLQDAFQAIEKTDITKGDSSMVYVDFLGDYMELKRFNGISLYGQFYAVALNTVRTASNGDGTATTVYTYKIQDNGQSITDPVDGKRFLLSENVVIELKHTYSVDAQGDRNAAGEQDLWIHIDEQVLPLVYHKVKTENDVTTYTIYEQKPVRFYYTVGVSDYVAPAGAVLKHRIDAAYLAENTDENGVVSFYANQYYAQDDDEVLVNHTQASGYGDAHNAITPDDTNRYYIHQYNYPIYLQVQDGGTAISAQQDGYGVPYDSGYTTQILSYADLDRLNEHTGLYSLVTFHAPTGSLQSTAEDGGKVYSGQTKAYYVGVQWEYLMDDVVFYDSVHGVYIHADGTTSQERGVWNENYSYSQYLETVEAYLREHTDVQAEDLQAYLAIGSWRIARFADRAFQKAENPTDTAALRIAPVLDSEDATKHEGTIVAWLGNNGRIGYVPQTPKQVTNAAGEDVDGALVVIGQTLTYTISATNHEENPAKIVITDAIPAGTVYVENSADNGAVSENGQLTWTFPNVAVGESVQASYQVKVTGENMAVIANTAYIAIGNHPAYETNTTYNPPVGKISASGRETPEGKVQVGDLLTYTIYYYNNTNASAVVTVSDRIPSGTTYVENSASYAGTDTLTLTRDDAGRVSEMTWIISQVPAGQGGSVHFQVRIHAGAVDPIANTATIQVGDNNPVISTNAVEDALAYGNLSLRKHVAAGNAEGDENKYFTLVLGSVTEGEEKLNGTFPVAGSSLVQEITFTNGLAQLQIKHGQTIEVQQLPAGITVSVYEVESGGYTPVYSADAVDILPNETVAVEITNTYHVSAVGVTLTGTKVLQGAQLEADRFSFLVVDANGDVVAGGSHDADGQIRFNTITYASAGVYTYTVREVNTGAAGIAYDATEYTVTVTVTDDGNGMLVASVTYPEGGLVFTNTYAPEGTSLAPQASKVLDGRELVAGEFSFVIKDSADTVVSYGNMDAQGNIRFGAIYFDTAGTYSYTMQEVKGNLGGVSYDETSYGFTVEVTDDGAGQLHAAVHYPEGGITFRNTYAPNAVSLQPTAVKHLEGKKLEAGAFTFVLADENGQVLATAVNDANGAVIFDKITYTQAGTYTYTLSERAGEDARYRYDDTIYQAIVVVSDDGQGNLYATYHIYLHGTEVGAATFYNHYTPGGIALDLNQQITITKTVNDPANTGITPEGFAFQVYNWNGDMVSDGISEEDGAIRFAQPLYFTEAGTYHYRVVEVPGDASAMTYDATEWMLTVTVEYDAETGLLQVANVYTGTENGENIHNNIQFVNTYAPAAAQVTISMHKTLHGRELVEGEFLFQLMQNGEVVQETRNDANGNVQFSLYLDRVGVYTYTVTEVAGISGGVLYDDAVHTVEVRVTENRVEGKLEAEVVLTEGNGNFVNEYKPNPASVTITARKRLVGRELAASEFTFLLADAEGNVWQVSNAADGTIHFPEMIYQQPGTYVYTLQEQAGDLGGVTYSTRIYTVTVTVTDDLAGNLVASVVYTFVDSNGAAQNIAEPLFRNVYGAEAVQLQLNAWKHLEGWELAEGAFTFLLTDAEGNVLEAVNDAEGMIRFLGLTYDQAGVYTYTLSEQQGEEAYICYDASVYTIEVTVVDDGAGQLQIASVTVDGQAVAVENLTADTDILFVNRYDQPPATGDIPIRLFVSAMMVSLVALVVLLMAGTKRRGKA